MTETGTGTTTTGSGPAAPERSPVVAVVLAEAHVLLAVVAVAIVTTMIVTGLRPDAEIAGVLAPLGAILVVPTLAYLVLAVLLTHALLGRRPRLRRWAWPLAALDLVVGLACLSGLVYAVVTGGVVRTSPLLAGLLPLALGVGLLAALPRRSRA